MILQKNQVFGNTDLKEIRFSPDGGMLKNFFQNLYANPHYAVMREYAANMQDSNPSGRKNVISFVQGNEFAGETNYISFRDYGSGVTPEFLDGDFLLIGKSTKTESAIDIGAYGVGRFVGFAVTEIIRFISYQDGFKHTTEITLSEKGYGRTPIITEPTNEDNGLEVQVYIDESFDKYKQYMKYLFMLNIDYDFQMKYEEFDEYLVIESGINILAMNNKIAYLSDSYYRTKKIIPKINVETTIERERLKEEIDYKYYENLHGNLLLKDTTSIYNLPDLGVLGIYLSSYIHTSKGIYNSKYLKDVVRGAEGNKRNYNVYKSHTKTGIDKLDKLIQEWVDNLPVISKSKNKVAGINNYVLLYEMKDRKLVSRKEYVTHNLVYIRRDLFDTAYLSLFPNYNFIDNCNLKKVDYLTQEQFEDKELEKLELATLYTRYEKEVISLSNLNYYAEGVDELKKFTLNHYSVSKHFINHTLEQEMLDLYKKYEPFVNIKVETGKSKFKALIEKCLATS